MRVLIVGSSGFIGSNLVYALEKKGMEVYALSRKNENSKNFNLKKGKIYNISLVNYEKLESIFLETKFDFVVNAATHYAPQENNDFVEKAFMANILLSNYLIYYCLVHNIPLISLGTYLQEIDHSKIDPTFYSFSKKNTQSILKSVAKHSDLRYTELLISDTYGPKDPREKILSLIIQSLNGKELKTSSGNQIINLVHIDDVCNAIQGLLIGLDSKKIKYNQTFSIRSRTWITLRELSKACEEISGLHANIKWGKKAYRGTEIFQVPKMSKIVPFWKPSISLLQGLQGVLMKK
jgi:CDP-3, 6-dideoxy-D-glycero-L-glycero-4-hexulose-4-reductase